MGMTFDKAGCGTVGQMFDSTIVFV